MKESDHQLKWKAVAIVMVMVCAPVLCTAYAAGSGTGGNSIPVVIESGSGVETASYIIYKDGDYTCAKSGTTGRIEIRNADSSTVLSTVCNYPGATIYIADGKYFIDSPIEMLADDVTLVGNGLGTVLIGNGVDVVKVGTDDGHSSVANVTIKRLNIRGGLHGVVLNYNTHNSAVQECIIDDVGVHGILLRQGGYDNLVSTNRINDPHVSGIHVYQSNDTVITDNIIRGPETGRGIAIYPDEPSHQASYRTVITSNTISGADDSIGYGIYLYGSVYGAVSGNVVSYCTAGMMLNVEAGYSDGGSNNSITSNTFTENIGYGIQIGSTSYGACNFNVVDANVVAKNGKSGIYIGQGSENIISNNQIIDNGELAIGHAGVFVGLGNGNTIANNVIVDSVTSVKTSFGVKVEPGCDGTVITANTLSGHGIGVVSQISNAGTNSIIKANPGFKTEGAWKLTFSAGVSSVNFAHEFAIKPTVALVQGSSKATANMTVSVTSSLIYVISNTGLMPVDTEIYVFAYYSL